MGFKEVVDLECESTIALGGINRKTGKANPTQVEGYFLGSKEVESRKSKTGKAKLHVLLTSKGKLGVWGKTDLDRKLNNVTAGVMVRLTQDGMVPTPNGDMYKYRVEIDEENKTEVGIQSSPAKYYDESEEEQSLDSDETASDEVEYTPARAPARAAEAPSAARQSAVREMLSSRKR